MNLIDTHAHVYLDEFDSDRALLMEHADKAGLTRILLPAIDSATHDQMLRIEKEFAPVCMSMMGLHPCSVKDNFRDELETVAGHLLRRRFVAIGETGLDFYWDTTFKEQQEIAFQQQIEWALEYNVPVVIHSRNATDECINMVSANQQGKLKGVFHCFSGNLEQARKVMDLGFYLGIGGVVTFKNGGLDKIMKEVSLERVVLETDAPYLAPVPFRGKRNEPAYITYVVEKLSEIMGKTVDEIASITTDNARKLFSL